MAREKAPPLWEIEWGILDVAVEQTDLPREKVSPDSRILEDLHMDSLALVEFIMAVEERFGVTMPDEMTREPFVSYPMRLRDLARVVELQWGTGQPPRRRWHDAPAEVEDVPEVPFTQLGGRPDPREWRSGPLYEAIGPNTEGHPQYRRRTDGMRCVPIPAGEAWIGSAAPGALDDQRPMHRVALDAFLLDAEPVSNTAYARFLNAVSAPDTVVAEWFGVAPGDQRAVQVQIHRTRHGWEPVRGTDRRPMILVSWFGANAYALWANRRDWRRYRAAGAVPDVLADRPLDAPPAPNSLLGTMLPSEAQWEYAARGGDDRVYPWGDSLPAEHPMQVAQHTAGRTYDAETLPSAPVNARLGVSPFGLHHMAGNVWQWCRDWYAPDFYRTPQALLPNAQNAAPTGIRCERGGSWVGPEELAACSYRRGRQPHLRGRCLGFRCLGLTEDL